ncbi:MAG: branched-chain amino acid ABC transporter substrate-binding protein [Alphaproteobacteria bacterium]|nr:branched-chain amino acid ABC transporter substrate-binding protein [Alphaproteobacteria bacterium]
MRFWKSFIATAAVALLPWAAGAQTVKIGIINTYSGPNATLGEQIDNAIKLHLKEYEKNLPPGVKIELIRRDDTGPNPEVAKRLAQELITRDKVNMLAGVVWTPNAFAIAPLATEAKVPFMIMNAGTSAITTTSPYIARVSFTLWQSSYPMGQWAAKNNIKRAYVAVSDFGPGHDAEAAFIKGFSDGGGQIVGQVRMPLANPDFVPFMQRVKDAKPEALFVFIPAGRQATAIMKAFGDLGLGQAGIKLIGPGDITTDEELPNMGDVALGVITVHHYTSAATRPANQAFVQAWKREYGQNSIPAFMAVGGWDGMAAILHAVREQKGRIDPDRTMALWKGWKNDQSPRGPIMIDPETRDIVQNEYVRRVERVGGALANVEFETIPAVKDPWKIINDKK